LVLVSAATLASLMPAARASRVDVLQALRSE
jgi:ABC-type lipoprotein release transport system permease subunit